VVEIWSNSTKKWARGEIVKYVGESEHHVVDGKVIPPISIKVEYKRGLGDYASKWVFAADFMQTVRYPEANNVVKMAASPDIQGTKDNDPQKQKKCKMDCGRHVQPGMTRNLNEYETCCKKCAKTHGDGNHDANCQGSFIDGLALNRCRIPDYGPSWSIDEMVLITQSDHMRKIELVDEEKHKLLAQKTREAIEKFGCGQDHIPRDNYDNFLTWLQYKSSCRQLGADQSAEIFTRNEGINDYLSFHAVGRIIFQLIAETYDVLYDEKKLNLKRSMFIRENSDNVKNAYKFGPAVGSGMFGTVYPVEHRVIQEKRVCKVIDLNNKGANPNPKAIKNEIRILAELDHPNVVKIYEFFVTPDNVYLIMEKCSGGELEQRIETSKATLATKGIKHHEKWIHDTIKQLLRALSFMHSHGIVHKDLKPANILYVDTSNTIKVIDFGLSHFFKPNSKEDIVAEGTPLYMAPEFFKPLIPSSMDFFKVDIWSLGTMMYEMITGSRPYDGENLDMIKLARLLLSTDPPPTPILKGGSLEMLQMCKSLLTKDPASRPTAPQALSHKWLIAMAGEETKLSPGIVQSLQHFNQQSELKKSIYFLIAHFCALPQLEQIRQLFTDLDDNNDGTLNQDALRGILVLAGMTPFEAASVVHGISRNGKTVGDSIQYTEFIAATASVRVSTKQQELLDYAFQTFDRTGRGALTVQDFAMVFGDVADSAFVALKDSFAEMDSDKTGKITKTQFQKYMKRLGVMGCGDVYSAV